MTEHGAHDAIHAIAAVVLTIGGAIVLTLAAVERRRFLHGESAGVSSSPADASGAERSVDGSSGAGVAVVAALSLAAAAIHMAAGPEHVERLGNLGLGFYGAALFQGLWALAVVRRPSARNIAWVGIAGNVAISAAWLWSRTAGLPVGPDAGHPETIGLADDVAALFQVLLITGLGLRLRAAGGSGPGSRRMSVLAAVPIVGVVFLASVLAVSNAASDHLDEAPDEPHAATAAHPTAP